MIEWAVGLALSQLMKNVQLVVVYDSMMDIELRANVNGLRNRSRRLQNKSCRVLEGRRIVTRRGLSGDCHRGKNGTRCTTPTIMQTQRQCRAHFSHIQQKKKFLLTVVYRRVVSIQLDLLTSDSVNLSIFGARRHCAVRAA